MRRYKYSGEKSETGLKIILKVNKLLKLLIKRKLSDE